MNTSALLKALYIATTSALVAPAALATPSFATEAQDEVHFTRAGGPRVELRVTSPTREGTRMTERTTRYARG